MHMVGDDIQFVGNAFDVPFVPGPQGKGIQLINKIDGRYIEYGHCFDTARGYRVYVRFQDSDSMNTIAAESAARIGDWLMECTPQCKNQKEKDDYTLLSEKLKLQSIRVDELNAIWNKAGRPAAALDKLKPRGRA